MYMYGGGGMGAPGIAVSVNFLCDITVFFYFEMRYYYRTGLQYAVFGDFGLRNWVKF